MSGKLIKPVYWPLTNLILENSIDAMDTSAEKIIDDVEDGIDLKKSHGQAIRDFDQLNSLIRSAFNFLERIGLMIPGKAIDIGSGTGVGAVILSKIPILSKVYALEYSEKFVTKIMPLVFDSLKADHAKIQRVVGDFNNIQLQDESLQYVINNHSLHHSENLNTTLLEVHRVLNKEGMIISIDRAWDDKVTREELDSKLDKEMNISLKKKYGIPEGESFTRRDYGEHEYTVGEWVEYFTDNGFEVLVFTLWHPPGLNRIWLKLPMYKIMMLINSILYRVGMRRFKIYGFGKTRRLFICFKKSN